MMFSGKLLISPGFACNFGCAHCANDSGLSTRLSDLEKRSLVRAINTYKIRKLQFIGGEPTLYFDEIGEIVNAVKHKELLSVILTTNGGFADSVEKAISVLKKIPYLAQVQLSYDKFHAPFLPFKKAVNLYSAVKRMGLDFGVISAIQSPMDLVLLDKLKRLGKFQVALIKVLPQGKALKNGVDYKPYFRFEKSVLSRKCPERINMVYFCGRGFSICCSSLAANMNVKGVFHPSPARLFNSRFYRLIDKYTFGELALKAGVNVESLRPEHSLVCNLCEHLLADGRVK